MPELVFLAFFVTWNCYEIAFPMNRWASSKSLWYNLVCSMAQFAHRQNKPLARSPCQICSIADAQPTWAFSCYCPPCQPTLPQRRRSTRETFDGPLSYHHDLSLMWHMQLYILNSCPFLLANEMDQGCRRRFAGGRSVRCTRRVIAIVVLLYGSQRILYSNHVVNHSFLDRTEMSLSDILPVHSVALKREKCKIVARIVQYSTLMHNTAQRRRAPCHKHP